VTCLEYRLRGQRGSAHKALIPGDVVDDEVAKTDLEEIVGPVASVAIVGTLRRPVPVPAPAPPPDPVPPLPYAHAILVGARRRLSWRRRGVVDRDVLRSCFIAKLAEERGRKGLPNLAPAEAVALFDELVGGGRSAERWRATA
jgi:hypothetical protein